MSTKRIQNEHGDKSKQRGRTRLTPGGLRAVMAAIAQELEGYELIAKKMEQHNVEAISMTGLNSLEQAVIKRIQGNVEAARRALNKETSGSLSETASKIVDNRTKPSEKTTRRKSNT